MSGADWNNVTRGLCGYTTKCFMKIINKQNNVNNMMKKYNNGSCKFSCSRCFIYLPSNLTVVCNVIKLVY